MRKTISLILALVIALSACGDNNIQPRDLESYTDSPAPIEILAEQIRNGHFLDVYDINGEKLDERTLESLNRTYQREKELQNIKWVESDLNANGLRGLIWQERYNSGINRILFVFALEDDRVSLVFFGAGGQMTSFFFLSDNGNIINRYATYGLSSFHLYRHFIFNDGLEMEPVYELRVIKIEDWAINELKEDGLFYEFVERNSIWAEAGVYYFGRAGSGQDEVLSEQQFLKAFKEMTGHSFYDSPVRPDWVDRVI